jgi:putative polyhydroxyalkanoate system protein
MSKPVVVTISHSLGKEGAKQRLRNTVGQMVSQLGPIASVEEEWSGDRMSFRLTAVGQAISGFIDVLEDAVRVEVLLPGLLGMLAGRIGSGIRERATLLLTKK